MHKRERQWFVCKGPIAYESAFAAVNGIVPARKRVTTYIIIGQDVCRNVFHAEVWVGYHATKMRRRISCQFGNLFLTTAGCYRHINLYLVFVNSLRKQSYISIIIFIEKRKWLFHRNSDYISMAIWWWYFKSELMNPIFFIQITATISINYSPIPVKHNSTYGTALTETEYQLAPKSYPQGRPRVLGVSVVYKNDRVIMRMHCILFCLFEFYLLINIAYCVCGSLSTMGTSLQQTALHLGWLLKFLLKVYASTETTL